MSKKTLHISIISAIILIITGGFIATAPARNQLNKPRHQMVTSLEKIHDSVKSQHTQIPSLIKNSSSDKDDQAAIKMTISKSEKSYQKQMKIYDKSDTSLANKVIAVHNAQSTNNDMINMIIEKYHISLLNDSSKQLTTLHKNYNIAKTNQNKFNKALADYNKAKHTAMGSIVSGLRPNKYGNIQKYKTVSPQLLLPFVLTDSSNNIMNQLQ